MEARRHIYRRVDVWRCGGTKSCYADAVGMEVFGGLEVGKEPCIPARGCAGTEVWRSRGMEARIPTRRRAGMEVLETWMHGRVYTNV